MQPFFASLTIDFGGGQPAAVSFDLSRHPDDGSPVVGLKAVLTAGADVLNALTAEQQEQLKRAVLNRLKDSIP